MGEYFQPRRRKIGVFLLFFPVVVMVGHVRSQTQHDIVQLQSGNFSLVLTSYDGLFNSRLTIPIREIQQRRIDSVIRKSPPPAIFNWRSMELSEYYEETVAVPPNCGGFQFTSRRNSSEWKARLNVPYLIVASLFILLSARLLFSGPRTKRIDSVSGITERFPKSLLPDSEKICSLDPHSGLYRRPNLDDTASN